MRNISSKAYIVARIAIVGYAVMSVASYLIFWGSAALGREQPVWFQVDYDGLGEITSHAWLVFVLQAPVLTLLLMALWYGYQALRLLEQPMQHYSALVRSLARFATALFLHAIGALLLRIVRASLEATEAMGEFTLILAINSDRITLLVISFILYCVCNALRLADEAVEETQSFL